MEIKFMNTDDIQPKTFKLDRRNGTSDYLFVLFKSDAYVYAEGKYNLVKTGNAIIFGKGKKQEYFPVEDQVFVHDFMHFDLESEAEKAVFDSIETDVVLRIISPEIISKWLEMIKLEQNSSLKYKSEIISNLGMIFLYSIKNMLALTENNNIKGDLYKKLCDLRASIYYMPQSQWKIDEVSAKLFFSASYFKHIYKQCFNVSFTKDVISARIQLAELLLKNNTLRISEIATKCGYNHIEHFTRQFKANTGLTPVQFRNKYC